MDKKKMILCDTNIFIDYFHEEGQIVRELDYLGFNRLAMSVVSVAEIYFGMRKRETSDTRTLISKFNHLHIDKETSKLFVQMMLGYKDMGIAIPDALIAATALANNMVLYTHNRKDFNFIDNLQLYNPKF